jgi:ribosome-binding factor A
MLPYKRSDRVSHNLQKEISDIIMNRVKDPRVGFLTITGVEVARDIKTAKVFVSVLNDKERSDTMDALEAARGYVRKELKNRLRMKVIPELTFIIDTSPQYADKIGRLLRDIEEGK